MKEVKLTISFRDLFGSKKADMQSDVRQLRWAQWQELALLNDSKDVVETWTNTSACVGCKHLDSAKAWCNSVDLPCTVNPILSYQNALPGMACQGGGYESTIV